MATTTTLQNIYKVTKEQYESIVAGTFEGHEYDENALYLVEDDGQIDLSSCLQVTRLEANASVYDALTEITAKYRGKSGYYLAEYNDNIGDEKAPLLILYSADPDLIEENVILLHPQGNVYLYTFNVETSDWDYKADLHIAYINARSAIQSLSLENNEIKYWTLKDGAWQSTGIFIPTKTSLGLDKVNNVAITDAQVEQIGKNADAISKLHNYDDTELRGLIDKKVDNTTTINSKPLTSNITLEKSDIGLGNVNNVAITDDQVTQIGTNKSDIDTLKTKVSNLTGAFTFQGSLGDNEDLPAATADNKGYVYIKGHKEYVSDGTQWIELGDEGSFVLKTTYESHLNEQKAKDEAQDAAISGKVNTSDYTKDQATQVAKDKAQDEAIAAIKVPTTVAELTDAGDYAKKADLFSKDYNDLTNKPTLFSGSYNDLTNKPTIPTTVAELTDASDYAKTDDLFSGSYNDLSDKPDLFDGNYNSLTNKPDLFSGSYNDLSDKPTLFDGNYNNLSNKPTIPTSTSQLTNDSGFVTATDHSHDDKYLPITEDIKVSDGQVLFDKIYARTSSSGTEYGMGTSSQVLKSNGTNVYWGADANSTSTLSVSSIFKAKNPYGGYQLLFTDRDNLLVPAVSSSGTNTGTSKVMNTEPFNPFGPIFYTSSASNRVVGQACSSSTYMVYADINVSYSFNCGSTLTAHKPFYVVAKIQEDGMAVLHSPYYSQTLPTSEDGLIYIYLGQTSGTNLVYLYQEHPIYVYKNGRIYQFLENEDSLPDVSSAIDLGLYENANANTVLNKITNEHKTESGTYKAVVSNYGHDDVLYIDYFYNDNSNNAFREYANAIIHSIGSSNRTYYYTWENIGTADGNFAWKLNSDSGTVASQAAAAFKDASVNGNTLTFTKNDGTTKDVTLPAGGESSGPLKIQQLTSASVEDGLNEIHDDYYDTNGYYLTTNDNLIRYERNKVDEYNDELIATVWENDGVVVYKWVKDGVIEITDKVWNCGGMYFHSGDNKNYVSCENPFYWNDNILQSSMKFSGDIQMAYYYGAPYNSTLFKFSNIYWGHSDTSINELTKLEKELPPTGLTYFYIGFDTDLTRFQGTRDGQPTISYSEVVYKDGWVKQNPTVTKTYTLSGDSGTYRFAQLVDINDMSRGECSVLCYGEIDGERTRLSNSVFTFTCGLNPDTLQPMADVLSTSQTPEITSSGSGSSGGDAENGSTVAVNSPSYGVDSVRFERHGKNVYAMLNILVGYQARCDNLIVEVKMTNSHNVELLDFMENVPDIVLSDEFSLLNGFEFKGYQDYSIKLKGPIDDLYTLASKDDVPMGWWIDLGESSSSMDLTIYRQTNPPYQGGGYTWSYTLKTPNQDTGSHGMQYFIKLDSNNDPIYKSSYNFNSDTYALFDTDIHNMFFDHSSSLKFKVTDLYVSLYTDIPGAQIYDGYEPIVMNVPLKIETGDKFFLVAENEYGDLESVEGDIYVSLDLEQTRFQISVPYRNDVSCVVEDFEIYSTDYYNTQIFIEEVDKHYTSNDYTLFSVYDFRYDTLNRLSSLEDFKHGGTIPVYRIYDVSKGITGVLECLTGNLLSNNVNTCVVCVNSTHQYLCTWKSAGYPGSWCFFEGLQILSLNNFDSYGVWRLESKNSDLTINGQIHPSNWHLSFLIIDNQYGEWKIRGSNVLYHQTKEGNYIFDLTQSDKQDTDIISEIMTQLYNHGLNYRYHHGQEFSGSVLVRNPIGAAFEGSSGGTMILDEYYIDCHTSFKNIDNWEFEYTCEFTKDNITYAYVSTIEDFESIISDWSSMSDYFTEYISYDDCKQGLAIDSVARSLGLSVMTKSPKINNGGSYWYYDNIDLGTNIIDFSKPVIIDLYYKQDRVARSEICVVNTNQILYNSTVPQIVLGAAACYSWGWDMNTPSQESFISLEVEYEDINDNDLRDALYDLSQIKIYYHPLNALSPKAYSEY